MINIQDIHKRNKEEIERANEKAKAEVESMIAKSDQEKVVEEK